jgi:hypothetical protein
VNSKAGLGEVRATATILEPFAAVAVVSTRSRMN